MQIKHSDYNIASFFENFDSFENSINKDEILKTAKIRVFVNTATYGDKMKVNKKAFEIFNLFSDTYQVYIINLDVGKWNGE